MFAAEIRKRRVERRHDCVHGRWHKDEVFVKIDGKQWYLWRAVDREVEVLDVYVASKRDKAAALKFLKRVLKKHGRAREVATDGLPAYGATITEIGVGARHETGRRLNNRGENSHQPFRRRERAMRRFRSGRTLWKFGSIHAQVHNRFNEERHHVSREIDKFRRAAALAEWRNVAA